MEVIYVQETTVSAMFDVRPSSFNSHTLCRMNADESVTCGSNQSSKRLHLSHNNTELVPDYKSRRVSS